MRPTRATWITVVTPLTTSAANTTHAWYAALPPTVPIRIAGVSTTLATVSIAYCRPRPTESATKGWAARQAPKRATSWTGRRRVI